jgi:hypothetical protein
VGEVGGVGRQGDGHEHTVCWATWGALGKGKLCVRVRVKLVGQKKHTISPTRDIRAVSGEKRIIESITLIQMKNIVCLRQHACVRLLRPRIGRRVARETEPELLDECVDVKGAY